MRVDRHHMYLEELIYHFENIGEDSKKISWIMKDGIWMPEGVRSRMKMPDIIAGYYDGGYLIAELKGSKEKKSKAILQIDSGEEMLKTISPFCYNTNAYYVRKFVSYSRLDGYHWENV
jgi:hypothetical protein